jgi:2-polyprenyl-3-methyl-5-hydroxy-6-metoxy-1,4-benzoquinol methylase
MPATIAKSSRGKTFEFGKNWISFIELVDDERIQGARASLLAALKVPSLAGRTFLDAGCGSGLFSLAAVQLGARVRSFDCDRESVRATIELRRRFARDSDWVIEQGSILDEDFAAGLGRFDVVYSWGVLHHTGDLWRASDIITRLVAPAGLLYISIYNDQGIVSDIWRRVKRRYNASGKLVRAALLAGASVYLYRHWPLHMLLRLAHRSAHGQPAAPRPRGMSRRHDLTDWVGGYPFEVAKPGDVFEFVHQRGFQLCHLKTAGKGLGCNEFVFQAPPAPLLRKG